MKANEVPEKIYVASATFPDYIDFDGSPINTKRIDDHDIEYIRADAFMKKACDAYCKACCNKPSYSVPIPFCRRKCESYNNFIKNINL